MSWIETQRLPLGDMGLLSEAARRDAYVYCLLVHTCFGYGEGMSMSLAFLGALQSHLEMFHSLSVLQPRKHSRLPNGVRPRPFTLLHLDASQCIEPSAGNRSSSHRSRSDEVQ